MELVVLSHGADDRLGPHTIEALAARLGDAKWTAVYLSDNLSGVPPELQHLVGQIVPTTGDLNDLIADHAGGRVLAVMNPEVIRKLAAEIYEVDLGVVPLPDAASLTCFRVSRTGVRSVVCLNDTLHLGTRANNVLSREDVHIS